MTRPGTTQTGGAHRPAGRQHPGHPARRPAGAANFSGKRRIRHVRRHNRHLVRSPGGAYQNNPTTVSNDKRQPSSTSTRGCRRITKLLTTLKISKGGSLSQGFHRLRLPELETTSNTPEIDADNGPPQDWPSARQRGGSTQATLAVKGLGPQQEQLDQSGGQRAPLATLTYSTYSLSYRVHTPHSTSGWWAWGPTTRWPPSPPSRFQKLAGDLHLPGPGRLQRRRRRQVHPADRDLDHH